jgi:hypothetical protein
MRYKGRIWATFCLIVCWILAEFVLGTGATLELGKAAGAQFSPSDNAFLQTATLFGLFRGAGLLISVCTLAIAVVIWRKPLIALISVAILFIATSPDQALAYYDKTDYTEAYTILPNESAFWIPDVGDNTNQAQFNSEEYLNSKKIATKRFIVPHAKLSGSGAFFDFYVPAGRLIIVDRTPYSREWVSSPTRGTSARDEGFPCQSKEGLNITVGVSVGTSVSEANAAKFLYRFGVVTPDGKRNDPAVIFSSIYYGRSLTSVMDDVGRKKIQTLVCEQIAGRSFDQANAEANQIMATVAKSAGDWFNSVGITLEFMGWADTFSFDKDVQQVVNDSYKAQKLSSIIGVLQAATQLEVQRGLGAGLDKHGLPIVVTPDILNAIQGIGKAITSQPH